MPYIFGPVNGGHHQGIWVMVGGYLSVALLLLAAIALATPGRRGLKYVLLGWTALVFGHMYGVPLLGDVLGALPEMGRIQFYRYATVALEFPVIVLAAIGVDDLTRVAGHRRPPDGGHARGSSGDRRRRDRVRSGDRLLPEARARA